MPWGQARGPHAVPLGRTCFILDLGFHELLRGRFNEIHSSWNAPLPVAPLFLSLVGHSSGTCYAAMGTSGSNGAQVQFEAEAADGVSAGSIALPLLAAR